MIFVQFSVIVPIYNTEIYLSRCIDSVLAQSFSEWELILVDDGSTDGSGPLADAYAEQDDRIRVLHTSNEGQLYARRAGLAEAAGNYVLFLDSDDFWKPDCLAVLHAAVAAHDPDVVMFTGCVVSVEGEALGLVGRYAQTETWVNKEELYRKLFSGNDYNAIWLKLFRRDLFAGDDTDYSALRGVFAGEDKAQALFPLTAARNILFIPDVLYHYTQNPLGVTNSADLSRVPRYLAEPVFSLLYHYMKGWGMDDAQSREQVAVYYLRSFLSVYYSLRRRCRTAQSRRDFRCYPWKRQVNAAAIRYRFSAQLLWKEKLRLWVALRLRL